MAALALEPFVDAAPEVLTDCSKVDMLTLESRHSKVDKKEVEARNFTDALSLEEARNLAAVALEPFVDAASEVLTDCSKIDTLTFES